MKLLTLLIIAIIPTGVYSQNGWKYLNKAEKRISNNLVFRVKRLITKAQNADYGFCGNAYQIAYNKSNVLVSKYYLIKQDTNKALDAILPDIFNSNLADNSEAVNLAYSILVEKYGTYALYKEFSHSIKNYRLKKVNTEYSFYDTYTINFYETEIQFWPISYNQSKSKEEIEMFLINTLFGTLIMRNFK